MVSKFRTVLVLLGVVVLCLVCHFLFPFFGSFPIVLHVQQNWCSFLSLPDVVQEHIYTQSADSTVSSFVDSSAQHRGMRPNLIAMKNKNSQSQILTRLVVPCQNAQTGKPVSNALYISCDSRGRSSHLFMVTATCASDYRYLAVLFCGLLI